MPINDFSGETFVAFTDISGFKVLMKDRMAGLGALRIFYQAGYRSMEQFQGEVEGFFISDCGVLFARNNSSLNDGLSKLLAVVKSVNRHMLNHNYMLTTSIAYGHFDYHSKIEFVGIEKNPIYGNAYVTAFLDNEMAIPKIQPGQCRIVKQGLPDQFDLGRHPMIRSRPKDRNHFYFYWSLDEDFGIDTFEKEYNDSYSLKYKGMLAIKSAEFLAIRNTQFSATNSAEHWQQ